jgi:hypothetical protein
MTAKPVASGRHLGIVLGRASTLPPGPERALWVGVICLALIDAELTGRASRQIAESARRFFSSDGFERVCEMLGINIDYARELIESHAAWAREQPAT